MVRTCLPVGRGDDPSRKIAKKDLEL